METGSISSAGPRGPTATSGPISNLRGPQTGTGSAVITSADQRPIRFGKELRELLFGGLGRYRVVRECRVCEALHTLFYDHGVCKIALDFVEIQGLEDQSGFSFANCFDEPCAEDVPLSPALEDLFFDLTGHLLPGLGIRREGKANYEVVIAKNARVYLRYCAQYKEQPLIFAKMI